MRRGDLLAGLAAAMLGIAALGIEGASVATGAAVALLGGALCLSRRRPLVASLIACAAVLGAALIADGALALPFGVLLVVHAFLAGRWGGRVAGIAGLVALTGSALGAAWITGDAGVPAFLLPTTAWAAGRALGGRERVAARLAERAQELTAERDAYARLSVRYERARIASELHDIVAHAISVMVVQASAGQRLAAIDPELTTETFEAIAGAARQAESDMGRLVAMLGDSDATGPAPDVPLIGELVAHAAGTGLDVSLRLEGDRESLPPVVAQAAYRVVQEGLTNALRHAAGAPVDVRLSATAGDLLVEVVNGPRSEPAAGAGVGTGNGLRGLRERITACGGSIDAGPQPDGGWRLAARLPRHVAAGRS